jgi:hypothetical protein
MRAFEVFCLALNIYKSLRQDKICAIGSCRNRPQFSNIASVAGSKNRKLSIEAIFAYDLSMAGPRLGSGWFHQQNGPVLPQSPHGVRATLTKISFKPRAEAAQRRPVPASQSLAATNNLAAFERQAAAFGVWLSLGKPFPFFLFP